ncbi:hypothetical protein [Calidifontibacter terrae]
MADLDPKKLFGAPGGAMENGEPAPEASAWGVTSYLISGPLMLGGVGWLLDHWLDTGFLLPVGILAGMALSMYVIWVRYGTG